MKHSLAANAVQTTQTKQLFARPEEQLSYELSQAVQKLPPLYTRLLASTISLVVLGAIAWANFSQTDEVAVAGGELIAATQVRPVTSLGSGVIISVKVKEGDRVTKGQVLVQKNPDLRQTDVNRLAQESKLIEDDLQRLNAERTGSKNAGTKIQDELLNSRLLDYKAKQAAVSAESNRQLVLLNQAKLRLLRLQENLVNAKSGIAEDIYTKVASGLHIAQQREENFRSLLTNGSIPRTDYLDAQERLNRVTTEIVKSKDDVTNAHNRLTEAEDKVASLTKDIASQSQEIRQAEQAYQAARDQLIRLASERESEILTQINKRKEELTNIAGQLDQAKMHKDQETIKAPVTGTIYKIKATTGPVQAGEELLSILPEGEEMLLEVKVLNRDIGFIHPGMDAKIKMATFPFQEFGTVIGKVIEVSPNAVVDQKLGLVFPTRIQIIGQHSINVRGQAVDFTPGMTADAEIITRQKSILTFIIEPITRRFSEAFSVR
jgi:HlyD family secretion protein